MELPAFLELLSGVQHYQDGSNARCPAHDDKEASLSVSPGEHGGIVVKCHAGCDWRDVVKAMGLTSADLAARPYIAAEYHYTDSEGHVLWTVERWAPKKDFRCRPSLPLPRTRRVLYARGWIEKARSDGVPILLVEGEKDAESAHARGIPATTCVGGSSGWLPHYAEELRGMKVIVVADNDEPGKAHARRAEESLAGVAASVRLVKPRAGKDLTEHFDEGFTVSDLDPLEQEGELIEFRVRDLVPEPIHWAWPGRIALGALTLIDGDPGDGKSVLTCDLAARWSSHLPMPDGLANPFGGPVYVVMVSAEDDPAATISPRLRAHGADVDRVSCIASGPREDVPFSLGDHLSALARLVKRRNAKVLILDPLMAYLPDGTDSSGDSSVRRALAPLMLMARRLGIAIIVVRHLNKSGTGKAIYRGGGSIAFSGMARAAYMVTRHPEDESARVFAAVKNNLAPLGSSLTYRLDSDPVHQVARVIWTGEHEAGAQELLDGHEGDVPPREIGEFFTRICAEPLSWREIVALGRAESYPEKLMMRNRSRYLDKVPGVAGNRDITWRARFGVAQLPLNPGLHLISGTPRGGKVENQAVTSENAGDDRSTPPTSHFTGEAVPQENSATRFDDTPMTEQERREAELEAAPSECDQCGQPAMKFMEPWNKIRCPAHNPMTYTAG